MFAPGLGTAIGSGIGAIIWETATIIKEAKEKGLVDEIITDIDILC